MHEISSPREMMPTKEVAREETPGEDEHAKSPKTEKTIAFTAP